MERLWYVRNAQLNWLALAQQESGRAFGIATTLRQPLHLAWGKSEMVRGHKHRVLLSGRSSA